MYRDYALNFAVLTLILFFMGRYFVSPGRLQAKSWKYKILIGITQGIFGILLLYSSVLTKSGFHLDIRALTVMMAVFFGGIPAGIISHIITTIPRAFLDLNSVPRVLIIGFIDCIMVGIILKYVVHYWKRWLLIVSGTVLLLFFFTYVFSNLPYHEFVLPYLTMHIIGGLYAAAFLDYFIRSNGLKQQMKELQLEMSDMLRLQPGVTFKFLKDENNSYIHTIAEGQFLQQLNHNYPTVAGAPNNGLPAITQENYDRAWQGEPVTYEMERNGLVTYTSLIPIKEDGRVKEVIGTILDISERVQAQKRIAESEQAKELADSANHAKSEFIANMSHEIRTPLNAILGFNYLLQQTEQTLQQKDYVNKTITAAKSLLTILTDILDFSKIEANKVELEKIDFDLYEVLSNIANIYSFQAVEKGLRLYTDIHHEVPQMLKGDPYRLNQVLVNLINNALKFTAEGEVSISVEVLIHEGHDLSLRFAVKDTGIGLTADQKNRLFKEFTQADMSTTRKYGGTGLGLVISKSLVELMGGTIEVQSVPGAGSEFSIVVPIQYSSVAVLKKVRDTQIRALSILIISDNIEMQQILKRQLEQFMSMVRIAESEKQAVESFYQNGRYDLILVDWKLKDTDAIKLGERIQRDFATRLHAIIIISAYHEAELQASIQSEVIQRVLYYPISQDQLHKEIVSFFPDNSGIEQNGEQESLQKNRFRLLQNACILLVEDNEINQIVVREILKGIEVQVVIAKNGMEAIEAVAINQYDAILMDLQMPVMDGFEAARRIRALNQSYATPIIAMTADAMKGVQEKVLEAGMNAYVTKPFEPLQLFSVLQQVIQTSRTETITASRSEAISEVAADSDGNDGKLGD